MARTLSGVARTFGDKQTSGGDQSFAAYSESGSESGKCGGSAAWSENYNELNYDYSLTIVFSNYNDCYAVLNGKLILQESGADHSVTMTLQNLRYQGAGERWAIGGTFKFEEVSTNVSRVTMNLVFRDDSVNKTYKLENYVVEFDDLAFTISISGKFYDHDHGYVTIETPVALYVATGFPTSGELVLTGAGGSTATVTFSSGSYTIEIDTDGNGTAYQILTCTTSGDCVA